MSQYVIEFYRVVVASDLGKTKLRVRNRWYASRRVLAESDLGKRMSTIDAPQGRFLAVR